MRRRPRPAARSRRSRPRRGCRGRAAPPLAISCCSASVCTVLIGTCAAGAARLDVAEQQRERDRQPDRREQQEQRERIAKQRPAACRVRSRRASRAPGCGGAPGPSAQRAPLLRGCRCWRPLLEASWLRGVGSSVMSEFDRQAARRGRAASDRAAPASRAHGTAVRSLRQRPAASQSRPKSNDVHKNDTSALVYKTFTRPRFTHCVT